MLPQPPPDDPTRTVGSFEFDSPLWWRKSGIWMVGIIMLVLIFLGSQRPRHGGHKRADQTQAVNNARQIGLALYEFQEEYGKFPDATTIAAVRQDTATDLNLGTKSANDFFRQLFATGIVQNEVMFYAKTAVTRKADNIFTKAEALKKGECAFAYFLGATKSDSLLRPVVAVPMIPGTDRFDPKPFKGKAVVLRLDNSVTFLTINNAGHAISNGMNLLNPANPFWGDKPPVIAWPDH